MNGDPRSPACRLAFARGCAMAARNPAFARDIIRVMFEEDYTLEDFRHVGLELGEFERLYSVCRLGAGT